MLKAECVPQLVDENLVVIICNQLTREPRAE
jgi:hypothetical protein